MKGLIESSINEKQNLDKEILEAYAEYYEKEKRWLTSLHAGKTIQDLINNACDKLEEAGCNLNETAVTAVIEKIVADVTVEFFIPQDFKDLQEALIASKEALGTFRSFNIDNQLFETSLTNQINSIEHQIELMLSNDRS